MYLDQSALSALARDTRYAYALTALRAWNEAGVVICLRSHEHRDETLLAPPALWDLIDRLSDELATGIEFRSTEEIEWREIHAAAREFLSISEHSTELWREAFTADPHTPRDDLFTEIFGGAVRVRARFEPADWQIAEVEHQKAKELAMTRAYDELRAQGFSYETMAEANVREMIRWKLPLADLDHARYRLASRYAEWVAAAEAGQLSIEAGSPHSRMMAVATRVSQTNHLVEQYPALLDRAAEFAESDELRHMPSLAYPALFRAALASMPNRRAHEGDGYDIAHLTLGLSRADFVTADSGMTQLCRDFHLVPSGCQLFSYRELADMVVALEDRLAS